MYSRISDPKPGGDNEKLKEDESLKQENKILKKEI